MGSEMCIRDRSKMFNSMHELCKELFPNCALDQHLTFCIGNPDESLLYLSSLNKDGSSLSEEHRLEALGTTVSFSPSHMWTLYNT